VETLSALLHELAPHHYGRPTAQALVRLAQASINSGVAVTARASSLRILCPRVAQRAGLCGFGEVAERPVGVIR
jgi:hypothetical protein